MFLWLIIFLTLYCQESQLQTKPMNDHKKLLKPPILTLFPGNITTTSHQHQGYLHLINSKPTITTRESPSSSSSSTTMGVSNRELCRGCQRPIDDRYLLKVLDDAWHESCLQCCVCFQPLSFSCFIRDNQFFCKRDYEKFVYFHWECRRRRRW